MSMSQEEIESLMSGIELDEEVSVQEEDTIDTSSASDMSENDIADLIAETNKSEETTINQEVKVEQEDKLVVDNVNENEEVLSAVGSADSVEVLENDSITLDKITNLSEVSHEELNKVWNNNQLEEGILPPPAGKDTKVVSNLNKVANDNEAKSLEIFNVLSLTLENNEESKKGLNSFDTFFKDQIVLLSKLNKKFPNISEFQDNLTLANSLKETNTNLLETIEEENSKIFKTMELMQFNDINRQKIERVMSVIRKLSLYLNSLFEDDNKDKEIVVAKHIHGDDKNDLLGDEDLESLISEFANSEIDKG